MGTPPPTWLCCGAFREEVQAPARSLPISSWTRPCAHWGGQEHPREEQDSSRHRGGASAQLGSPNQEAGRRAQVSARPQSQGVQRRSLAHGEQVRSNQDRAGVSSWFTAVPILLG